VTTEVPATLSQAAISSLMLVLAGVALYLVVQALLHWVGDRTEKLFLLFAGWSVCSAAYVIGSYWQYTAPTVAGAIDGVTVTVVGSILIPAFVLEVVARLTGRRHSRWFRIVVWTVCIALALTTALLPGSVVTDDARRIDGPFGHTFFTPVTSPLFLLYIPLIMTVWVTAWRDVLASRRSARSVPATVLMTTLALYVLAGLNDVFVTTGVFPGITVFEYATIIMVLLVDWILVRSRRQLHDEVLSAKRTIDQERRIDSLTGLANRQEFERLANLTSRGPLHPSLAPADCEVAATATPTEIAVVSLDISRFKAVNDAGGYSYGDLALQAVSERLGEAVALTPCRLVARAGGDEFLLLVVPDNSLRSAAAAAREVVDEVFAHFDDPLSVWGEDRYITFHAGIAAGSPRDDTEVRALVNGADTALRHARRQGHDVEEYTAELVSAATRSARLEADLPAALAADELYLRYQPKVDIASGRIIGAEALIRWEHAELGMVYPDEFIRIAEEAGLISAVDIWVLRSCCQQVNSWLDDQWWPVAEPLQISLNVSGHDLARPDFSDEVETVLTETGTDPALLQLEVTETAVMSDLQMAVQALTRLRRLGFHLAIDDFGTGYSSLSYLANLPFDEVKLDRAFIAAVPGDSYAEFVTKMVIDLGRHKGSKVTAEGIETDEQLVYLRNAGCQLGQGWLFGRPMPPAELAHRVARSPAG